MSTGAIRSPDMSVLSKSRSDLIRIEVMAKAMRKDYRFRLVVSVKSYNSTPDGMRLP